MDDVQVAVVFGGCGYQACTVRSLEPAIFRQAAEKLVGLGLDTPGAAEARVAFGYVDRAQLASPVVDIPEEVMVDLFQVIEIIRRKLKVDLVGRDCCEFTLGTGKLRVVTQPDAVTKDIGSRIAIGILAASIFTRCQAFTFRQVSRTVARAGSARLASACVVPNPSSRMLAA